MSAINVNSKWFNNLVAQLGHFGWGCMLVLAFATHHHVWWGAIAVLAWAAPKEFLFDKYVEGQSFNDNALDFLVYCLGLIVGLIILVA